MFLIERTVVGAGLGATSNLSDNRRHLFYVILGLVHLVKYDYSRLGRYECLFGEMASEQLKQTM